MACDVSWKSRLSKLNDENVLLKTQVDFVVQERENVKLEYQKLFNSIKATQAQHQQEVNELIENISQKTYAYGDVRSKNQDLLMAKKASNPEDNTDRSKPVTSHSTPKNKQKQEKNANVIARGMNFNSVRRPTSKDTKSENRVMKNTNAKSSSAYVRKTPSSVRIDSNKHETKNSNECQSKASVLNTKTVTAVNDGSNLVCVSCGKNMFLISHEKCVARYALSIDSRVKRALFTTPVAAKSKNLETTSVVAKSRFSITKTLTATNKVSSVSSLSPDSKQSRTLSNYMKNKIATSRKWQIWFEYQSCFNWTPKSKTAQSSPSVSKSNTSVRTTSKTPVITQNGLPNYPLFHLHLFNVMQKFMGTVCFGNDHFAAITGYGDYVQGNLTICHVYYVEGLGHNLFSVGHFSDEDLEVAFHSNTCYVWNLEGDDLLTSSRESNLYTISISELTASSLVCLMSKATSTKSWVWHRRLSHLNFGIINQLTSKNLVYGLLKFKYDKDHLCSVCEQGKSEKASSPSKLVPSTETKLDLIHMDLCGPMRVESINGKKYILVIVDDYSRYTWAQILKIRIDNGSKFKNEKLRLFYAKLEFLWIEAITIACFTQNRFLVHTWYNKTLYELIRGRKPNVQYFHVFGSLCYPTNDHDDLGKMKPKVDISIFIGYFESSRGLRIYNCRTKKIMETIHVKFDELTAMASECNNSGPGLNCLNFQDSSKELNEIPSQQDLDNLFGPLYEEYYASSTFEVSSNSAANTLDDEDTSSLFSIIIEDMSLTEPKNIKEAILDHSWIESMQDELNQLKRLDMWELVPLPKGKHAIKVKWL
ncbi:retrovirus-related pol polyprotein from transposon TNT 1-94 [Tanacetum coccineum]|uniref:Retrovirus-related pol polyprotein from transposon TNT 1-94 n=1 Tax=Tanacetum coccineum TaxID=301880 RepID=A0ABQ5BQS4_9ASTR